MVDKIQYYYPDFFQRLILGLGLDWCKFVKSGETLGQFFDLLYLELPYADAASPHKEHDRAHVGKQALGDKEIGSSQK